MQALPPCKLPDPFDRVEAGPVGREIVELESAGVLLAPVSVQAGMAIASIVGDNRHPSWLRRADTMEGFEENREGSAVELIRLPLKEELAVAKPNLAKVAYAAAGSLTSDGTKDRKSVV